MRKPAHKHDTVQNLIETLQEQERRRTTGDEAARRYAAIHEVRFHQTFHFCKTLCPSPKTRILDVGPSTLTTLLAHEYRSVTTLGLDIQADNGGQRNDATLSLTLPHISFELNNSKDIKRWPKRTGQFDCIVFAETLEHISSAPEYSLLFLRSLLAKDGILLLTTPNAAAIMKRLILLLKGKNPFERIRLNADNPGHYREYTLAELFDIGARCGLQPIYHTYANFYTAANFAQAFLKRLSPSFRDSIVIAFKKLELF